MKAFSPGEVLNKDLSVSTLLDVLNQQLVLSKYVMKTPSGVWYVAFFELGHTAPAQKNFNGVENLYLIRGWTQAKIVDNVVDIFKIDQGNTRLPEPVWHLLDQELRKQATEVTHFPYKRFALVLFDKNK